MIVLKSRLLAAVALVLGGTVAFPSLAAAPLQVIASFSILGDLAAEVGGDHVEVTTLVGPNGDAHVYEPTPADARATVAADLVIVNGLGFEGWLERLVEASGYSGPVAISSDGVKPLRLEGTADPHTWQSIENAKTYVQNILTALCAADANNCADYQANAGAYVEELKALDASIKAGFAAIADEKRKVITTHDAFGYFAQAYGIAFLAPQGASTDSEASAADVASLIEQIRREGVTALFVENISDPRLIEQIGRETSAQLGGELYSDALSEPDGPAPTYLEMMWHNANLLQRAMLGS